MIGLNTVWIQDRTDTLDVPVSEIMQIIIVWDVASQSQIQCAVHQNSLHN